jgi:hypothetical protein
MPCLRQTRSEADTSFAGGDDETVTVEEAQQIFRALFVDARLQPRQGGLVIDSVVGRAVECVEQGRGRVALLRAVAVEAGDELAVVGNPDKGFFQAVVSS